MPRFLMTKRPVKFKLDAYRHYNAGRTPLEAFALASQDNDNVALSGCMTTRSYASSYMSDDIRNWIRKRRDEPQIIEYFEQNSLDLNKV
jgi:hypothetical protein